MKTKVAFFTLMIAFAYASHAQSNNNPKLPPQSSFLCNEIVGVVNAHSKNADFTKYELLKTFIIEGSSEKKTGVTSYAGIDLDNDKKGDNITRSCGSGIGRLCSLTIQYSSGKKLDSFDRAPFYLGKIGEKVYLIEQINVPSSNTRQPSVTAYSLTNKLEEICRAQ